MKDLYHPNVIRLETAFYTQGDKVKFGLQLNFIGLVR